ncbi:MAG: hypothetical protein ABIG29_01440 [Candidatus Nealsonbacteria bacterium]
MKFLEKIRDLPERTRKIILWVVLIVFAAIMLVWWISRIPKRLDDFQAGQFIEQLDLPKMEMPQMPELPDLNNIEINAPENNQTQEN